jgi:GT2 family glycosyltransferase
MKLTIVIPCLNLWNRYTRPCLASIRSRHPYRIVLVDNGSSDETCTEASKLVSHGFMHRRYETNLGTSRAWNWGVRDGFEKCAEYVLVLNNDVLLHAECVDRLVDRFERDSNGLGMVSALDVRGEIRTPEDLWRLEAASKEHVEESEHPNFSAFMLNRRCWETVGEFDENFFPAYFEDNDYHYRMQLADLRAIVHPQALFYHFGSRTQNEARSTPIVQGEMFERNRSYYVRKWGGPPRQEQHRYPFGGQAAAV